MSEPSDLSETRGESDAQRRRRLAKIFGEEQTQTSDDQPEPGDEDDRSKDAWLRAQVPPHHG